MLDKIIASLKDQVGDELMNKIGLSSRETEGSLNAAAGSVKEILGGGNGLDIGNVMSLLSKNKNNAGADDLMGKIGENFFGKLTNEVGLSNDKAFSVKDTVLPALMNMLSDKVGGDKGMLGDLMGKGGGVLGKLGGLTKMFK